jgi:hypothetical protein
MIIGVPKGIKPPHGYRVAMPPSGAYQLIRGGHRFGDRARLARTGRRPADQIKRTEVNTTKVWHRAQEAIGETPMAATGTVAIPFPSTL